VVTFWQAVQMLQGQSRLVDVVHKAGGTGYSQVFWLFSASVIAQVVCTVFIFHRYYKILSTDITIT